MTNRSDYVLALLVFSVLVLWLISFLAFLVFIDGWRFTFLFFASLILVLLYATLSQPA